MVRRLVQEFCLIMRKLLQNILFTQKNYLSEKPWAEFKDRTNVIQELADGLIKQKVAEFLDKKKERLRIYWKSLESWADSIVEWAKDIAFSGTDIYRRYSRSKPRFFYIA